jgi:hypothetical protein
MEPWVRPLLEILTLAAAIGSFVASVKQWRVRWVAIAATACAIVLMGAFAPAHGSAFWLLIAIQLLVLGWLRGRRGVIHRSTNWF